MRPALAYAILAFTDQRINSTLADLMGMRYSAVRGYRRMGWYAAHIGMMVNRIVYWKLWLTQRPVSQPQQRAGWGIGEGV